jgi:PIN domain nuclease of toxin-antitoxin system
VNLLLDTAVLLWWLDDNRRLRPPARDAIADEANLVVVSAASAWEISIKAALGKLRVPDDLIDVLDQNGFSTLTIDIAHVLRAGSLPRHHSDPFDRMLIAQAMLEELVLVTADERLSAYPVEILAA